MVVPKCSRSGDIIEPLSVPQWFCNCDAMAKKAVDVVRGGEREVALRELKLAKGARRRDSALFGFTSNLFPRRLAPLAKLARGHVVSLAGEHPVSPFLQASASLCLCPGANSRCHHSRSRDWCISRQLWWGHRIPAYFVSSTDGSIPEVRIAVAPPRAAYCSRPAPLALLTLRHACTRRARSPPQGSTIDNDYWVSARSEEEARAQAAKKFKVSEDKIVLTQDPDVLDTWCDGAAGRAPLPSPRLLCGCSLPPFPRFSSGIFPISIFNWPEEHPEMDKFYPGHLLETGACAGSERNKRKESTREEKNAAGV